MCPDGMHALSHDDDPNFAPLNTSKGQSFINEVIERIGGVDLITFDNIMSLIAGDMKEEESWRQTLPWILSLTSRNIGQIWVHHTGHDETRGYGSKTREWMMDTVLHLDRIERADTDVSFQLTFRKARERTPDTRADIADVNIAMVNDRWTSQGVEGVSRSKGKPSGMGAKFLDALRNATIGSSERMHSCPAATLDAWRAECRKLSLLDPDMKPDAARSLFSKYKRELIALNLVACNETHAWTLGAPQLPLKAM